MSSNISAWTLWINMVFRRTSLIHRGREFKRSWQWISAMWMAGSRKMFVRLGGYYHSQLFTPPLSQ